MGEFMFYVVNMYIEDFEVKIAEFNVKNLSTYFVGYDGKVLKKEFACIECGFRNVSSSMRLNLTFIAAIIRLFFTS
ncbi:hypothetical protein DICVIV_11817 [Dictyocaulus viviparus]|uniref:Uncharacterized protein n=1 Tax=Dictyocaulus viviparus TaxID=29172 RepID=A0A0D8XC81_DICVI|nr:hypothetical protein DICVIV_11817 [Dictyocaulus viviparus]